MTIVGDWDVTIKTPIGSLVVGYTFIQAGAGWRGSAAVTGTRRTVPG